MIEAKSSRFIKDCWYVAAWDNEVPQDAMLARTLLNEPVLLYRRADGVVAALEDRCCHRAAPLSRGRREGDCVRCMYHGMKFDANGVCVEIPGQERIPPSAKVKSYPVVERDRFVWIWMGDPGKADPSTIRSFWWQNHPDWRMEPGMLHYEANYQLIVDNLLDFSHLTYVHGKTIGLPSMAQTRATVEPSGDGLRITRLYLNDQLTKHQAKLTTLTGPVDRSAIYEWHPPAFMRLHNVVVPAGADMKAEPRPDGSMEMWHSSVQTPETESTCFYFYCTAHNFHIDNAQVTRSLAEDIRAAFIEDKGMIEAQQKVLNAAPRFEGMSIVHDQAMLQARRIIEKRLQQEGAQ